jgi:hypothetical protein
MAVSERKASTGSFALPRFCSCYAYRLVAVLGPRFFTLGLWEPRGSARFAFAGLFFRASRFSFFR